MLNKVAAAVFVVVGVLAANPAQANEDALALAQKNVCTACHGIDTKLVGPSYQDVAKKYAGNANALTELKASIKAGGAGKWGQIPMPPQPQLSDEQLTTLAQWILSIK